MGGQKIQASLQCCDQCYSTKSAVVGRSADVMKPACSKAKILPSNSSRNTLHPRSFREIDQVGVLLVGSRHGFRRPKLAVEPPKVVVLLNLRVVDVHLRRGPGKVGLAGLVVVEVRGVGAASLHGVGGKDGLDNDAPFADCFQAFGQLFDSFEPAFLPQLKQGESCGGSLKVRSSSLCLLRSLQKPVFCQVLLEGR